MANADPGADPVKYQFFGRLLANSNISNKRDSRCWSITDDYWLVANSVCSPSDIHQKVYLNTLGEIRVLSHPGFCLHALYGYYYKRNRFTLCYSDSDGGYDVGARAVQKFTFDSKTGQLRNENDYIGKTCSQYDSSLGYIGQRKCSGSSDQKFLLTSNKANQWTLISEGSLPWISEDQRNPVGVQLLSTYDEGDPSKFFAEVRLYNSTTPYDEYKILFPETRDPGSPMIEFAELELPGMLLNHTT